jgi:NAD dependent epimerase/dehydratase family.
MKIALLGANGFVGQNVVNEFKKHNLDFFPVSREYGFDLRKKSDNIRFLTESNCSIILNCAAHVGSLNYVTKNAADVVSDNTRMILSMYDSVREINPEILIINPVANCGFPADSTIFKEDEFWNGPLHSSILSYGLTRRYLIGTSECYRMQAGIKSINLFTPNMYGPHDSTDPDKAHALNALVSKFVKAGQQKKNELEVWGSGKVIREWLYVKDFARIALSIIQDKNIYNFTEPINIAQNWGLSIKSLVDLIIKSFGYKGNVNWNTNMPDGAIKKVMDDARFRNYFPEFKFTSLEQGIQETTNYYLSRYPY